jgi:aryl-alcohol dehydrogenase-like predicted oxidoreductase
VQVAGEVFVPPTKLQLGGRHEPTRAAIAYTSASFLQNSKPIVSRQSAGPCSRRRFLELSVLSGTAAVLPLPSGAADRLGPLITKPIPATGEKLPVLGIGTNQFGRVPYDDVRAILQRMHQLGGTVIDTAAAYGESEVQIGKALGELNLTSKMFIATKLNAPGGPGDGVGGLPSFERSVQRLQKIDLLFIHFVDSVEAMMPAVTDLKKQGKVRYIGITSIRTPQYPQLLEYMRSYPLDFLQVNYSLGDRAAEAEVLPLAQERKIAVMAAVPLGGGRNLLIKQTGNRQLPSWAAQFGMASWSQFFLKYVVSHPAISCAIPGSSKLEHLEDNQAAGHGQLPDAQARRKMEAFWAQSS